MPYSTVVKLKSATGEGQAVGRKSKSSQSKCLCGKISNLQCSICKSAKYCCKKCQQKDWERHKPLCDAIKKLSEDRVKATEFVSHLTPAERRRLVSLVGRRCEVRCRLNGRGEIVLWDSGAMVSILSKRWLKENYPDLEIRDVRELLDRTLEIRTANKGAMSYCGWVELTFQLNTGPVLHVPFLVTKDEVEEPLVGFNVIYELLMSGDFDIQDFMDALNLDSDVITETVELIQACFRAFRKERCGDWSRSALSGEVQGTSGDLGGEHSSCL